MRKYNENKTTPRVCHLVNGVLVHKSLNCCLKFPISSQETVKQTSTQHMLFYMRLTYSIQDRQKEATLSNKYPNK